MATDYLQINDLTVSFDGFVAVDTVKGTLSRLFERFEVGDDVPQNQKRAVLARRAVQAGVVRPRQ